MPSGQKILLLVINVDISPSEDSPLKPGFHAPIYYSNEKIEKLIKYLYQNEKKRGRIHVAFTAFDDEPKLVYDFAPLSEYVQNPPKFKVEKNRIETTKTAKSLEDCLQELIKRKVEMLEAGIETYVSYIITITDVDEHQYEDDTYRRSVCQKLQKASEEEESSYAVDRIMVGVGDRMSRKTKAYLKDFAGGDESKCFYLEPPLPDNGQSNTADAAERSRKILEEEKRFSEMFDQVMKTISSSLHDSIKDDDRRVSGSTDNNIKPRDPVKEYKNTFNNLKEIGQTEKENRR